MESKKELKVIEPNPKSVRLFFFLAGIIATIAYRIIIVLNFYDPLWVKISWYIGTVGFVFYFWHRYRVAKRRADLIERYELVKAVDEAKCINPQKRLALHYLVKTTLTSKSKWNSGLIFLLSFLALVVGIFLDLF